MNRRRWLLAVAAAMAAAAVVVYAMSTPLLSFMGRQLVHEDPLQQVDALIVLSGGMDRIVEAAEVYRGGYAPLIVLTTEPPDPTQVFLRSRGIPSETSLELSRRVLQALGVDPMAVVTLDEVVRSTADEARVVTRWARGRPIRSIMLVTSPFHTARARLTFLHAFRDQGVTVLARPSTLDPFRSDSWWRSRRTLRDGIFEFQKLLYYRVVELTGSEE